MKSKTIVTDKCGRDWEGDQFTGQDALDRMNEILGKRHLASCFILADGVGLFYGDHFLLTTYPTLPVSPHKAIAFIYSRNQPEKAHIRLTMDTDQVAESLVHELLHLDLVRLGFPWTNSEISNKVHKHTFNHIHHELMLPIFKRLGLDPASLYSLHSYPIDWTIRENLKRPEYDFSWWCMDWLAEWQTWRHTGDNGYKCWELEEWGKVLERFPTFEETTHRIEEWFEDGEYKDPTSFESAYNKLVVLMGMPPEDDNEWFRLYKGESHPIKQYGRLANPPADNRQRT